MWKTLRSQSNSLSEESKTLNTEDLSFTYPTPPETSPKISGRIDYVLFNIVLILTVVGLIFISSASAPLAQAEVGDAFHYFKKQLFGAVLGITALFILAYINLKSFLSFIRPMMIGVVILLVATHIPSFGVTIKGASRWLNILGFTFQPSELAKLVIVMFLSIILGNPEYKTLSWRQKLATLIPVGGILALILLQPDLGTTVVITTTVFVLYFSAGMNIWKFLGVLSLGFICFALVSWNTPYQRVRILSFMNPWADPQGTGFHLVQSMIAIGSGGIMGNGIGQSIQKLFYLPEPHTDFIFSVISEELGFVGGLFILLLFVLLAQRGFAIACRVAEPTLKLLAVGLTSLISAQAFINIGVVTGSIPTTGLTLPFISSGSSSLIVTLCGMGLLLNISRYVPSSDLKK